MVLERKKSQIHLHTNMPCVNWSCYEKNKSGFIEPFSVRLYLWEGGRIISKKPAADSTFRFYEQNDFLHRQIIVCVLVDVH